MILPGIIGFVVGRFVSKKSQAILGALVIGAALGLIASYTLIPLLYPVFAGDAGLVVGPEFDSVGIMLLVENLVIYTEAVFMRTRSYVIDLAFVVIGAVSSSLGAWLGTRYQNRKAADPFTSSGTE